MWINDRSHIRGKRLQLLRLHVLPSSHVARRLGHVALVGQVLLVCLVERVEGLHCLSADELGHAVEGIDKSLLDARGFATSEAHGQEHEPVFGHAANLVALAVGQRIDFIAKRKIALSKLPAAVDARQRAKHVGVAFAEMLRHGARIGEHAVVSGDNKLLRNDVHGELQSPGIGARPAGLGDIARHVGRSCLGRA